VAWLAGLAIAEIPSGRILFESSQIRAFHVSWSPCGKYLVVGENGKMNVLDPSGKIVGKIPRPVNNWGSPAINPGGTLVAVLTDTMGIPELYDVVTGRQILSFHGIEGGRSMSWSPDGSTLAVACKDGYVDLLQAPRAVAQATDDKRLGPSPGR
jgi:WD40 repeat protein